MACRDPEVYNLSYGRVKWLDKNLGQLWLAYINTELQIGFFMPGLISVDYWHFTQSVPTDDFKLNSP